jgi:hypothetical protein
MRSNLNRRFSGTSAGKASSEPPSRIFLIRNHEEGLPILHDFGGADRASHCARFGVRTAATEAD